MKKIARRCIEIEKKNRRQILFPSSVTVTKDRHTSITDDGIDEFIVEYR
jgi:hypothetical protein